MPTPESKFSEAYFALREVGVVLTRTREGEYLVKIKNSPPGTGYYGTNIEDAYVTGMAMVEQQKLVEGSALFRTQLIMVVQMIERVDKDKLAAMPHLKDCLENAMTACNLNLMVLAPKEPNAKGS